VKCISQLAVRNISRPFQPYMSRRRRSISTISAATATAEAGAVAVLL